MGKKIELIFSVIQVLFSDVKKILVQAFVHYNKKNHTQPECAKKLMTEEIAQPPPHPPLHLFRTTAFHKKKLVSPYAIMFKSKLC